MLSVSSQGKYNFYHQNTLLDAFRANSRNVIGRNLSMVIPLLANQELTPMLFGYPLSYPLYTPFYMKSQSQENHKTQFLKLSIFA